MASKVSFLPYIYRSSRGTLFVRITANPKMIRLDSKSIPNAIKEIESRRIFKRDKSSCKKEKLQKLKSAYWAALKLKKSIAFFRNSPLNNFKLINNYSQKEIEIKEHKILFSTEAVLNKTDKMLNSKIRELVR
tara:strand:- start:85 stop:483 length:399 start_codon:yes stop_codon:yes gene_type:complete